MIRLLRSLALALLVLATQQGAVLHALGHATQHERNDSAPGGEACALCLAFAHIDAGATPAAQAPPALPAPAPAAFEHVAAASAAADLPAARSRGPPRFL